MSSARQFHSWLLFLFSPICGWAERPKIFSLVAGLERVNWHELNLPFFVLNYKVLFSVEHRYWYYDYIKLLLVQCLFFVKVIS